MRRVAPSVVAREQLQRLFDDGVGHERNIVSALVETVTRLVVQELLEGEQGEFLGGRGRYERRGDDQVGSRNGYERGRLRTAEGFVDVAVPKVRGMGEPFRSTLMSFLEGNSEVLESLVNEMYARGLSTRDVEDAFRDATGELLISKSAVSQITDQLWEDYQAFVARDLSEVEAGVPVRRCVVRVVASARRQGGTAGGLVHRLRGSQTPAAPGGRQQGVRGLLDRVLPRHARPRATDAHHDHVGWRARAGEGDHCVLPSQYPDSVLIPLCRPRDYADLDADSLA
jgi:putative transposase